MLKCPRCERKQGRVELVDNRYKDFFCCACGERFPMKHYRTKLKEYHQSHQDELEVVEVDVERI